MKKVEKVEAVAAAMTNLFKEDWKGFEFEKKAKLILVKDYVPGKLAWMLTAQKDGQVVPFILECSTRYAYPCPMGFAFCEAEVSDEVYTDNKGNEGKICLVAGEVCVVWE